MAEPRDDPWRIVDEIQSRNQDKDPLEVERDVAETLEEIRAARRSTALRNRRPAEVAPPRQ